MHCRIGCPPPASWLATQHAQEERLVDAGCSLCHPACPYLWPQCHCRMALTLCDWPAPAGRDFMSLERERQLQILKKSKGVVFSRAEPKHKQDIIRLLKELGEVVAMTGAHMSCMASLVNA